MALSTSSMTDSPNLPKSSPRPLEREHFCRSQDRHLSPLFESPGTRLTSCKRNTHEVRLSISPISPIQNLTCHNHPQPSPPSIRRPIPVHKMQKHPRTPRKRDAHVVRVARDGNRTHDLLLSLRIQDKRINHYATRAATWASDCSARRRGGLVRRWREKAGKCMRGLLLCTDGGQRSLGNQN